MTLDVPFSAGYRKSSGQDLRAVEFNHLSASLEAGLGGSAEFVLSAEAAHYPRVGALSVRDYERIKRFLDIAISASLLLFLLPLLGMIGLLIKIQDGGPVLYGHTRIGKNGRRFRCYKFRSMVRDADRLHGQLLALSQHKDFRTFKIRHDPRITALGRLLRRSSLDELPQLWNILRGDMTLVGPRPALPAEVALYSREDRRRLEVAQGLTCLWQINGRANIPFNAQVGLDLEYIQTRSLIQDLKILALTLPAVVSGRGAY